MDGWTAAQTRVTVASLQLHQRLNLCVERSFELEQEGFPIETYHLKNEDDFPFELVQPKDCNAFISKKEDSSRPLSVLFSN